MGQRRRLFTILLPLAALFAAGCDIVLSPLGERYTGPTPNRDDIVAETVIVRKVSQQPGTGILFYMADRVRFLNAKAHDINRVVEVMSRDIHPEVASLGLAVGDTILISTQFVGLSTAGELSPFIPDWPFDRYVEYPLGLHTLTSVERLGP